MSRPDDIRTVIAQEAALVFSRFDEAEAFALGAALRDMALRDGLPVIVDIRLWDRPLFYCALPGSTDANREWARRKINAVRMFHKSTYRMVLEQSRPDRTFAPDTGLSAADYALAGGGFPIRVEGLGAIGVVAVSGLPQRRDHNLVVAALRAHLSNDDATLALSDDKN